MEFCNGSITSTEGCDTIWVEYYIPYTSWFPHNIGMYQCCVDISCIIYLSVRELKEYWKFNTWWIIVLKCLFIKCPSMYRWFYRNLRWYMCCVQLSSGYEYSFWRLWCHLVGYFMPVIDTCSTLELPFINWWVRVLKENQEFDTQQVVVLKVLMKCPRVYNWYHGILY